MRTRSTLEVSLLFILCASLIGACGDDGSDSTKEPSSTSDAGSPNGGGASNDIQVSPDGEGQADGGGTQAEAFSEECTTTVGPGSTPKETTDTLVRALVRASSGDTVCLVDGRYMVKSQLNVNTSGIEIRGESESETILDFSEQTDGSNGILAQVEKDFTVRDLTMLDTPGDALKAKGVDGVVFQDVTIKWTRDKSTENGAYAFYPVEAKNILIDDCTVKGARDAGVYVGQSEKAVVRNSEAFGNVVGIEIENTKHAEVYGNNAHDNTAGILVIALPDLMVKVNNRTLVYDNRVVNNNIENFGKSGTTVSKMPPGTGIIVLSTDDAEFRDNEVEGHKSVGIGVGSHFLLDQECCDDEEFDPHSEGNWVHDNTLSNNGTDPQGRAQIIASSVEGEAGLGLFWDGVFDDSKDNSSGELTNCFGNNEDGEGNSLEMARVNLEELPGDCSSKSGSPPSFCQNSCQKDAVEGVELPDRVTEEVK